MPLNGLTAHQFSTAGAGLNRVLNQVGAQKIQPLIREKSFGDPTHSAMRDLQRSYVMTLGPQVAVEEAISRLSNDPAIDYVEPDYLMKFFNTPNDPNYSFIYALNNTGQTGGTSGSDIDAELAWDTETGDETVVVAVIDSGLDWDHADLDDNIWSNTDEVTGNNLDNDGNGYKNDVRGYDFGDGDNDPDDDCFSIDPDVYADGHGTHVAGIIGAEGNNAVLGVGVAWDVQLMPLKVAMANCTMPTSAVVSALAYAQNNGAKVVNMSLGGPASGSLQSAIEGASGAGLLLVAAAGNDGGDDASSSYPAAYSQVMAVVATDDDDLKASYSNYGNWVTLAAPGDTIYSTLPMGGAGYKSGTSMASPMVAGVAALVYSQYPSLTAAQVKTRLTDSCEDIDGLNPGIAGLLGAGRVNAARALMGITSISPNTGVIGSTFSVTIMGHSMVPGLSVSLQKSGQTDITATNVVQPGLTVLTGDFDLTGVSSGTWDVVITIGQTSKTIEDGFNITGLTLNSVDPSIAPNSGISPSITLSGENFSGSMTAELTRTGQTSIPGQNLSLIDSNSATIEFDLTNQEGGRWNVELEDGDLTSILPNGFAVTSDSFDVVTINPSQNQTFSLSPAQGSQTIEWPSGTVQTAITLDLGGSPTLPSVNSTIDPYTATGIGLEITPSDSSVTLNQNVTITLSYRLSDLVDPTNEDALTLAVYNTTTGRYEPIASVVNKTARTVTANIPHLSLFAIVQHVPSLNLSGVVAFPNPFKEKLSHDRITFDFLTAGSKVQIYDVAGTLIHELLDDNGDGQIHWAVRNNSGEKVASGMYFYLVTDANGNKKVGKLGVIR